MRHMSSQTAAMPSCSAERRPLFGAGTIDAGRPVSVSVNSGTAVFSGALTLGNTASAVVVASGATVTHTAEDKTGVQIFAQTLTVSGDINANAKGCGTNKGINGSGDCAASNAGAPGNSYGGAGHGGVGGSGYYSSGGTTYGSSTNPALLGSGGGPGGVGGGRVGLTVDGTLTINGTVTANGGAVGGSGGSVYVSAAVLNGSGGTVATELVDAMAKETAAVGESPSITMRAGFPLVTHPQ